jgi:hypothetical protein
MTRVQGNGQPQALVGQVDVTNANGHLHKGVPGIHMDSLVYWMVWEDVGIPFISGWVSPLQTATWCVACDVCTPTAYLAQVEPHVCHIAVISQLQGSVKAAQAHVVPAGWGMWAVGAH